MKFNIVILSTFFALQTFGSVSAVRGVDESYQDAKNRSMRENVVAADLQDEEGAGRSSAEDEAVRLGDLKINDAVELANELELNLYFKYIRDTQFFNIQTDPFPRRISWLYPDDGCYVRAEIAYRLAEQKNYQIPSKVFVFGNLRVETKNAQSGVVRWWYHVAPAFRVQNDVYILDPSINPEAPLKISEWDEKMKASPHQANKYSICTAQTMYPNDKCSRRTAYGYKSVESSQHSFLKLEWKRLVQLNRDPNEELNQNPPWSH